MNGRTNTTSVTEVVEGVQVALEAPTNLVLTPLNARVDLTWTDPVDKYAAPDGQTATNPWDNVATWDHSIVVRKAGSAPTSPSDGELIYTETTRNQHQYTAYSDTDNVINNTEYHYAVYAVTTMDIVSDPVVDHCKPIEGTPTYIQELEITAVADRYVPDSALSINNNVLFRCTYNANPDTSYNADIFRIDESQTQQRVTPTPISGYGSIASANNASHAMYAGGTYSYKSGSSWYQHYTDQVVAYDSSFTQQTVEALPDAKDSMSGVGFNKYIIFAGGYVETTNNHRATNTAIAYDDQLTQISIDPIITSGNSIGSAGVTSYAVFAGGGDSISSSAMTYDTSLTKNSGISGLTSARRNVYGVTIDNHAAFLGGCLTTDWSSNYFNGGDIYDSSLSKLSAPQFPVYDTFMGINVAVPLGGYSIIGVSRVMGESDLCIMDNAFTLTTDLPNDPGYGRRNVGGGLKRYAYIGKNSNTDATLEVYEAR